MPRVRKAAAQAATEEFEPASGLDVDGEQVSDAIDSPAERGGREPVTFFQRLETLSEPDWESHVVYVYRSTPVISKGPEGAFIWKTASAFDEDDVLQAHGSGRYTAVLYRKASPNKIKLATHTFTVYRSDLPPKVLPGQVKRIPENEDYFATWGAPAKAAPATAENPTSAQPPHSPASERAVEVLADLLRQTQDSPARPLADPGLMDLWKEAARERDALAKTIAGQQATPAVDPVKMIGEVLTLADRLKGPTPAPAADPLALVKEVLSTVREAQGSQQPPKSALEQLQELAAMMATFREMMNPPEPEPPAPPPAPEQPNVWIQALGAIAPALAPLTQAIASRMMQMPIAEASSSPPQPAAPAASTPPAAIAPQPPATDPSEAAAHSNQIAFVRAVAPALMSAVRDGQTGSDFAATFIGLVEEGESVFEQLKDAGVLGVSALLQLEPTTWNALVAEPRWPAFLREFLAFDPSAPEPAPTPDTAASPRVRVISKSGSKGDPKTN